MSGAASGRRRALLLDVFGGRPRPEQHLLARVLGGELRQGALDGVMADAVAKAAGVPSAAVRRAHMLSGDLGVAAPAALTGGETALVAVEHGAGAGRAADAGGAGGRRRGRRSAATGPASVEWKLDGARIQAHRRGDDVRLFTRNLNEITDRLGVVDRARRRPARAATSCSTARCSGVDDDGAPRRFQDTMGDFGADAPSGRGDGLSAYFFDVLHVDGDACLDEPLAVRRRAAGHVVPAARPRCRRSSPPTPPRRRRSSTAPSRAGHEGVMVKALDSPYDAGRRGGAWRKVKPVHTLDLVVLAAEWGHGRRRAGCRTSTSAPVATTARS